MSDGIRIYLTGTCEGFEKLREALAQQPGIEVVGVSDQPAAGAAALQGGHLDCVLHATGSSALPGYGFRVWSWTTPSSRPSFSMSRWSCPSLRTMRAATYA